MFSEAIGYSDICLCTPSRLFKDLKGIIEKYKINHYTDSSNVN